jgi:phosphate transport system substrate-binding protein
MNDSNTRKWARLAAMLGLALVMTTATTFTARAQEFKRLTGEGSSWAQNAIDAMRVDVQANGISVEYAGTGSTTGRKNFINGQADFAASDIPFQFNPEDGSEPDRPVEGSYAYIPVVAGGTAFMYNLKIAGQQVTNLRLSGENLAKVFTGGITQWNDPAIAADNPGLALPARPVVPVVRSDGSGSSAQFTKWMIAMHGNVWQDFCERSGRAPACGYTSFYPTVQGMIAQNQDSGVASYVQQSQAEGAIGYVNYSYALNAGFPVVKVLNAAGFYTEPTPENVAVSLLQAQINEDASDPTVYLTQNLDNVYTDPDPRNYQLSSYSYFILRTATTDKFDTDKGYTLAAFAYYAMCQAQQQSASLGYSPMPINLVAKSFEQIAKIPGAVVENINVQSCNNPTFAADGHNRLADEAPFPKDCDRQGADQCPDGTAGMRNIPTNTARPAAGGTSGNAGNSSTGGTGNGSSNTASGSTDGASTGNAAGASTGSTGAATGSTAGASTGTPAKSSTGTTGSTGSGSSATVSAAGTPVSSTGSVSDSANGRANDSSGGPQIVGDSGSTDGCDPDTGLCVAAATDLAETGGTPQVDTSSGSFSGQQAVAAPVIATTLDSDSRVGGAALVVLVSALVLALVAAPTLTWRSSRKAVPS